MALRTSDSDTKEDQDAAYNPGELKAAEQFSSKYSSGKNQAKAFGDDRKSKADNSSTENIDNAKKEENAGWQNKYTGGNKKRNFNAKAFFRKKAPIGVIITVLGGGGGIAGFLTSGGLLPVHFKEEMAAKFNDQLAAMDIRTTTMIKKKFKGTTKGFCTKGLSIGCKFNTMPDKKFQKLNAAFEANGGKVNKSGETFFRGRARIDSIEFQGRTIPASQFPSELRNNPAFRSVMIQGTSYNPLNAGTSDNLMSKMARKLGIQRSANVTGNNEAERRRSVVDSANGNRAAELSANVTATEENCSSGPDCTDGKRTVYRDIQTREIISQEQYNTRLGNIAELGGELNARRALTDVGSTVTKATLKGALTATALGLGAVDSMCGAYRLIRAVGFAAKYLGSLQLLRYAYVFMNTADKIKAGEAQPEEVEYIGKILTSVNDQGHSATDSYGFKYAAYGDTNNMPRTEDITAESIDAHGNNIVLSEQQKQQAVINDETTKYINGQLVSDNVLSSIIGFVDSSGATSQADATCKFVKSGWGQTILFTAAVVGLVVAFFSGGLSLTWGAGAQVAAGVSISVAIAMLTPKLIDMAAGTLITGLENGNQAGNAITAGMGALNAQSSQARGLAALSPEAALAYQKLTDETIAQYNAVDSLNRSPLDPTSRNTFMGSIVSRILPYTTKFSSLSRGVSGMTQFTMSSLASIIPTSNAIDKAAELKICQDRDYKELNIAADPFCNLKFGLSPATLNIDSDNPDLVLEYMINNNYIDEMTGEPKEADNEYAEYIKNCMERSVAIGGFVSEDDTNTGEECIQGKASGAEEYKRNMFRLFFIDMSINDGLEEGYANTSDGTKESSNGVVASPVAPGQTITSGYGPRSPVQDASNGTTWHAAIDVASSPTDVFAAMAGDVVSIEGSGVNTVTIKHADGLKTRYMHMYPQDVVVEVGSKVTAGQKIGKIGCAGKEQGFCSGDHLDFSIWIDEVKDKTQYSKYKTAPAAAGGDAGKAINPANYLTNNGVAGYQGSVNEN